MLVKTLNDALGEGKLAESQLEDAFETYWPRLETTLARIASAGTHPATRRDMQDVLEEILTIVRGLARKEPGYMLLPGSEKSAILALLLDDLAKQKSSWSDILSGDPGHDTKRNFFEVMKHLSDWENRRRKGEADDDGGKST